MKTVPLLLVAASLVLTPSLMAQDDAGGRRPGRTDRPDRPDRARRGHVLRLRGVADGEMLKLFALDMRFRGEDATGTDGPRGAGMVRIGEDRFHAKVVEVEFGADEEPVPMDEDEDEADDDEADETVHAEDEAVSSDDGPDDRRRRRRRRRRHVTRLVVELHASDSAPMPEPMPMEVEPAVDDNGEDMEGEADVLEPEIAPVEPPPTSNAIGKLVLERGSRPLGEREVPVAQGEASVEGASYAILARAPMNRAVIRKVRRRLQRHRRNDRRRDRTEGGDVSEPNTGAADSVDGGF